MLDNVPIFGTYNSKGKETVKVVSMRECLTVNATDNEEYVGTMGLGPCIGLALVGKEDGKPKKITVAHIDALTDLESLRMLYRKTLSDCSELDVTLISSGNERNRAVEILDKLTKLDYEKNIKNVSADLTCSTNFAVNTKTGDICINLPNDDFDVDKTLNEIGIIIPSGLHVSPH